MNNMRNKILMTLALLLTAVTGAWATEPKVINSEIDFESLKVGDIIVEGFSMTGPNSVRFYFNAGRAKKGETLLNEDVSFYRMYISSVGTNAVITLSADAGDAAGTYTPIDENGQVANAWIVTSMNESGNSDFHLSGYKYVAPTVEPEPAEPALTVEWNPATKTGNFTMPAYDVEIAPIYAPVAQWAKVDNVDQLPTAIEGIYAESTDAIVKAGTVAKIGETENPQGTVMYAVTSTNQATAPALDAFSADVPTAENITIGTEVLVWYYIKGADTPEGQTATAENTFNDSEICAEPITVTLLSNKFDIQFKAANDNTIEAGKATVTVGGTAATVTEGKLEGVKMDTEVKVTAKEGYKFRKVEVKKKGAKADPSETITFSGGKNANYTYTGTHFSATGEADPTDGTFELNKWSSVTINATDGKTITKVVFSYRENGNNDLDQLSFSSGTFDGIDTVNDVNATMLSVTSTTVGATKLNGVTIYYK